MAVVILDRFQEENERYFFARLQSQDGVVQLYEQPSLQQQALDLMPVSEMRKEARKESEQTGKDERDCLMRQVNKWFYGSFFHWLDKPKCSRCGTVTKNIGPLPPTVEERRWLAGHVEGYKCPNCGADERFPRYNHPGKLLETRHGRCGEHANCQALLLRSMGFEVRHVTDWTDHVWVEVYSYQEQRWITCDRDYLSREREGRKLSYIVAVSNEETVDVTWRYSTKQNEVMQRRLHVSEEWLAKALAFLNHQKQQKLPPVRRQTLKERSALDLAEFLSNYERKLESKHIPYTFSPTDEEINSKRLQVQYCCASDKYFRGSKMETFLQGWKSGAAAVDSVFRKCEHDWTIVLDYLRSRGVEEADLTTLQKGNAFLARLPSSPTGLVSWTMDFSTSGLVIDSVTIVTCCVTMESGKVDWKLEGDDDIVENLTFISQHDCKSQKTSSLSGCKTLKLTAALSGGRGKLAWKHAQLCSQPIDSEGDPSLDITITLKESTA